MLDATIVNVSLADIGRDMGASVNLLQWVVNAYTLVFAALLLGGGTACDRFGAKRVYLIGLAVFACGSMACALSGTVAQLIVSRALQGIGAAGIVPSSLSLIPAVISERRQQTRIIGLWGGAGGAAAALGPVLGGALVSGSGCVPHFG